MHDPTWPYVHVFGRLRVVDINGDERLPRGTPERTLLSFMALSGGTVHIEHAVDVLWPGLPLNHGRHRLRNVLTRLHMACGQLVIREGLTLVLRANTDVREYEEAVARLLMLAGLEIAPESRYEDWADAARRRLNVATAQLAALI